MMFLKEFLEKLDVKKVNRRQGKHKKYGACKKLNELRRQKA